MTVLLFNVRHVRYVSIVVFFLTTATATLSAEPSDQQNQTCVLSGSIDRAYFSGDVDALEAVLANDPGGLSSDAAYIQALAHYRLAVLAGRERSEVRRNADRAIDILEARLVDHEHGLAEDRALLSGAYGMKISANFLAAIRLGPKSTAAIETALSDAPDNPRVLLLDGIRLFNTPGLSISIKN